MDGQPRDQIQRFFRLLLEHAVGVCLAAQQNVLHQEVAVDVSRRPCGAAQLCHYGVALPDVESGVVGVHGGHCWNDNEEVRVEESTISEW